MVITAHCAIDGSKGAANSFNRWKNAVVPRRMLPNGVRSICKKLGIGLSKLCRC